MALGTDQPATTTGAAPSKKRPLWLKLVLTLVYLPVALVAWVLAAKLGGGWGAALGLLFVCFALGAAFDQTVHR